MPTYILKLEDTKEKGKEYFMLWSSVVDAPVSVGMDYETFRKHYFKEYGMDASNFPQRMERVNQKGVSCIFSENARDFIRHNRAGEHETELTYEQILDKYCRIDISELDSLYA